MADMVLNLDVGPCPSEGRKEHFNRKHQQFVKKRKFLERRGFLKQKQLPPKQNASQQNSGHQANSWDQGEKRGDQEGHWTSFNRSNKQCNQTGFRNRFHPQDDPNKCYRNASVGQSGMITVNVSAASNHSSVTSYTPNKSHAPSKASLVNGQACGEKTQSRPSAAWGKANLLSEFESGLSPVFSASRPSYKMVAIDCEMVGTGLKGRNSDLARCSIVNFCGDVVYDKYIKPESPITDYRTRWSGIRREHMINAIPFGLAQKEILKILNGKIVIGHAIHNDFKALKYFHPKEMTRDTSMIPLLNRKAGFQEKEAASLKRLAKQLLHKDIQVGRHGHSSVEDAKTTMELYRVIEAEWERQLAAGPGHT
ncbi:interferon-stimulated 20 kDa exonuclease-like 2 [Pelodytes ibericus]